MPRTRAGASRARSPSSPVPATPPDAQQRSPSRAKALASSPPTSPRSTSARPSDSSRSPAAPATAVGCDVTSSDPIQAGGAAADHRRVRPDRRRLQQCRRRTTQHPRRRTHRVGVGPRARHQPPRSLPVHEAPDPPHARAGRWRDRQHLLRRRGQGAPRRSRPRSLQVRRHRPHQDRGYGRLGFGGSKPIHRAVPGDDPPSSGPAPASAGWRHQLRSRGFRSHARCRMACLRARPGSPPRSAAYGPVRPRAGDRSACSGGAIPRSSAGRDPTQRAPYVVMSVLVPGHPDWRVDLIEGWDGRRVRDEAYDARRLLSSPGIPSRGRAGDRRRPDTPFRGVLARSVPAGGCSNGHCGATRLGSHGRGVPRTRPIDATRDGRDWQRRQPVYQMGGKSFVSFRNPRPTRWTPRRANGTTT